MKYRDNTFRMDIKAKAVILASIFLAFFVILLPIWQKGLTRQTHYEILLAESRLETMEEEERTLVAYILEREAGKGNEEVDLIASL